ncbi:Tat pathway signal sequence domain protein [Streptomyces sp. NPDC004610]|uniref:Tat pathway signal sequence domain protein n=1 Tax=unclassified Streptomyces TaxID=2593676 RepID=UPI0033BF0EF6
MREIVRRHLGKVVAGAGIAVAGTAAMVAVTLPGTAGADDNPPTGATGGQPAAAGAPSTGKDGDDGGDGEGGQQGAVAPGVVQEAPAQGERGKGRDPLTDDELRRVEEIALGGGQQQSLRSAESVDGERGPERIGTDLAEPDAADLDKPDAPRRADVTYYDYKTDTVVTKTVNLDTGKVEKTGTQRGVQPPLTHAETLEAAELLLADPLGAGLKADYKDATGKALTSTDQLKLTSMVYRAAPGAQDAVLDKCGEHRCARLFPKVVNGPWIDARAFVIDLSTRKVGTLTP